MEQHEKIYNKKNKYYDYYVILQNGARIAQLKWLCRKIRTIRISVNMQNGLKSIQNWFKIEP